MNQINIGVEIYPELPEVLSIFVGGLKSILFDNITGIYMIGSLATGDFDLDSDIDFLVITQRDINEADVEELNLMHSEIHKIGYYPAEHLEGSYISKELISDYSRIDEPVWYLENGDITLQQSDHDNKWHVRWILREKAVILCGEKPDSFLSPVPPENIIEETKLTLQMLQKFFKDELNGPLDFCNTRFGQSYSVLCACRFLETISTGVVKSKLSGMKWGLQQLDSTWHKLISDAWEERKGVRFCKKIRQRAEQSDLLETMDFIDYAVENTEKILSCN